MLVEHSYSLIKDFENVLITIKRATNTANTYGADTQTWSVIASNVLCRLDQLAGRYQREVQGAQGKDRYQLFIDSATNIRIGDVVTVISDSFGVPVYVYRNGVAFVPEYLVRHIHNPGSEYSHLEVDLTEIVGETQN